MLKALLEREIRPDLCVGTSVGAINATFLAFDPSPAGVERLSRIWLSLGDEDLFPGSRFKTWTRVLMRGNKIFENSGIRRVMETRLGRARFEDAQIPLAVIATDMDSGAETVFRSGDLLEPILASTAMPGIFPPVEIAGRMFIDGGVSDAVPVTPAVEMGSQEDLRAELHLQDASRAAARSPPRPHPARVLALARQEVRTRAEVLCTTRWSCIVVTPPKLDFTVPFTSMRYTAQLEEIGYRQMVETLDGRSNPERTGIARSPLADPERGPIIVPPAESSS